MHPSIINQKVERIKGSKEDINKLAEEYKPLLQHVKSCSKVWLL